MLHGGPPVPASNNTPDLSTFGLDFFVHIAAFLAALDLTRSLKDMLDPKASSIPAGCWAILTGRSCYAAEHMIPDSTFDNCQSTLH